MTEQIEQYMRTLKPGGVAQERRSISCCLGKHAGIRGLTPTIVNEFVKKNIVHTPDRSSGHRRQRIELVGNFIGEVNLTGGDQTMERPRKGRMA